MAVAAENEMLIDQGFYHHQETGAVAIGDAVQRAVAATRSYAPGDMGWLLAEAPGRSACPGSRLEVTPETSLQAAQRLKDEGCGTVAVLNFASATTPGGGYLTGATAQEEDLCRCSSLQRCLLRADDYYAAHRAHRDPSYSHRVIYSPDVPVFRDDDYRLLPAAYPVTFLSCPAPNTGRIARDAPELLAATSRVLTARSAMILAVAARHRVGSLVLGAWGCGVFRNAPAEVAAAFRAHLAGGGQFAGYFNHIVFAVYDRAPGLANLAAFQSAFGGQ